MFHILLEELLMLLKIIILLMFIAILYCLGSASLYLIKKKTTDSQKMAVALTWRISLSLILFLILILSFSIGWIQPHGLSFSIS